MLFFITFTDYNRNCLKIQILSKILINQLTVTSVSKGTDSEITYIRRIKANHIELKCSMQIQIDESLSDLEVFQSFNTLNLAIMRITDSMTLVFFKLQAFFQLKIRSQNFSWKLLVSFFKPFNNFKKTRTPPTLASCF